jgi:hypothetical protein
MRTTWTLLTLPLLLVACATAPPPSETALRVQVHRQNSTLLDKCKRLEAVTVRVPAGGTGWDMSPLQIATVTAEGKAREQVAMAGGDTLVLTTADWLKLNPTDRLFTAVQVQGIGFKCN